MEKSSSVSSFKLLSFEEPEHLKIDIESPIILMVSDSNHSIDLRVCPVIVEVTFDWRTGNSKYTEVRAKTANPQILFPGSDEFYSWMMGLVMLHPYCTLCNHPVGVRAKSEEKGGGEE